MLIRLSNLKGGAGKMRLRQADADAASRGTVVRRIMFAILTP